VPEAVSQINAAESGALESAKKESSEAENFMGLEDLMGVIACRMREESIHNK